ESSVACTTTASTIRSPVAASRRRGSLRPRLERAVGRLLAWEGVPRGRARVELTLLDADAMRRLNRRATGRRGLTDVLAFALPQPDGALLGGALVAGAAALWAGLLALGEEAAVGEALHTLGDAPPATVGARVPLHRALHVARLALLVLGAVAAGNALGWWGRPWAEALGSWAVAATFLFIVGDALPRSLARVAPELAATAL